MTHDMNRQAMSFGSRVASRVGSRVGSRFILGASIAQVALYFGRIASA